MIGINVHIYPSTFKFESRILKETKSILDLGLADKIIIVALWEQGMKDQEKIDEKRQVVRFRLFMSRFPKNLFTEIFKFSELMFRVLWHFRKQPVSFVNAHSLSVLPIGVLMTLFGNRKLIYDAHELETQRNGLYGIRQKATVVLEKMLMPFVDRMIVVSDSIAEWYKKNYKIEKVYVVRNVPYFEPVPVNDESILKNKFGLSREDILFIYQGLVAKGRGIELLLNSFKKQNGNKHLVIMGYGDMEDQVKEIAAECSNIHFQPAVKQHEIIRYTSGADVGISLIENTCLSYYYCLPNKLFEYLMCGIPVIISDFPDMGRVVDDYDFGWKTSVSEDDFSALIQKLSIEEIRQKKANAELNRSRVGWQIEEKILTEVYKSI